MLYKLYNYFFLPGSRLLLTLAIAFSGINGMAQCPQNLDFENGTFNGWVCWTGNVQLVGGTNKVNLVPSGGPVMGRHEMLSNYPGDGPDPYGLFPKNCPNGSRHSIKLGNSLGGSQAEGVSYTFTIPLNQNKFSLIYYYAVVFQEPGHPVEQQPRLQIDITNVTDGTSLGCSSFSFVASSGLPGFFRSNNQIGNTPIWCKDWSATTINLDGNAGKTIQLFFKTADCTPGGHFGYAYVDVNTECSSSFIGATFCKDDTAVSITAPYGYQNYKWYNTGFTQLLGTQQVLRLSPPPATGSTYAVELVPFSGYGCVDTLYANLVDTLTVIADAGHDTVSCNNTPVPIGAPPKIGLVYKWTPASGLTNPDIANPNALPSVTTQYVLKVNHDGGGCISTDTVLVQAIKINDTMQVIGNASSCGSGQNVILQVQPTDSIQWFKDGVAIPGANKPQYIVAQSGLYNAVLFAGKGCNKNTIAQQVDFFGKPLAGFNVNNNNQCLPGHQFIFTNTSTVSAGILQYSWDLGDGTTSTNTDVTHIYANPGVYQVKLLVTGAGGCTDSSAVQVSVYATPTADFSVSPVCTNLPVPFVNNTVNNSTSLINYLWDFGNGQTSTAKNPSYSYTSAGTYVVKLTVNTVQCPVNVNTKQSSVIIDAPLPNLQYPVKNAVINFPLNLQARVYGNSVLWTPSKNLDRPRSYNPVFYGSADQLYTIELKTATGCITVDTQLVKAFKKIEIYVPLAFTPNSDGVNDYLRPFLMGFKKVNFFKVYNRWGQLVFQMSSDTPGWNGKVNGIPQDTQAVVWMIEAEDIDGVIHRKQGSAIIMR